MAEPRHSGQCASSSELSADEIWSRHRINGEIAQRRDVLLHQWEVVYRCNGVEEDVLFWSRNALHQLQLFYSPREFCSFSLASVYIPPQADANSTLQKLTDLITDTEQQHPDSVLIILGDFNKANFPVNYQNTDSMLHVPPKTVIYWITVTQQKIMHITLSRAALELSLDHCLVHLIPYYR